MPVAYLQTDRPNPVMLLGVPMVVWRDGQGEWRVFKDQCPHRKAPLSGEAKTGGGRGEWAVARASLQACIRSGRAGMYAAASPFAILRNCWGGETQEFAGVSRGGTSCAKLLMGNRRAAWPCKHLPPPRTTHVRFRTRTRCRSPRNVASAATPPPPPCLPAIVRPRVLLMPCRGPHRGGRHPRLLLPRLALQRRLWRLHTRPAGQRPAATRPPARP